MGQLAGFGECEMGMSKQNFKSLHCYGVLTILLKTGVAQFEIVIWLLDRVVEGVLGDFQLRLIQCEHKLLRYSSSTLGSLSRIE